jgi:hypothetical protein
VYSIAGRNARVIQAHYEKGKFIIRKTEHISFEKENIDGFKLFLRWIMNIPKGETIRDPTAAPPLIASETLPIDSTGMTMTMTDTMTGT